MICNTCGGYGDVVSSYEDESGIKSEQEVCISCNGLGVQRHQAHIQSNAKKAVERAIEAVERLYEKKDKLKRF